MPMPMSRIVWQSYQLEAPFHSAPCPSGPRKQARRSPTARQIILTTCVLSTRCCIAGTLDFQRPHGTCLLSTRVILRILQTCPPKICSELLLSKDVVEPSNSWVVCMNMSLGFLRSASGLSFPTSYGQHDATIPTPNWRVCPIQRPLDPSAWPALQPRSPRNPLVFVHTWWPPRVEDPQPACRKPKSNLPWKKRIDLPRKCYREEGASQDWRC